MVEKTDYRRRAFTIANDAGKSAGIYVKVIRIFPFCNKTLVKESLFDTSKQLVDKVKLIDIHCYLDNQKERMLSCEKNYS